MSTPYNPSISLEVGRGGGLHFQINDRPVDDTYGAIVDGRARGAARGVSRRTRLPRLPR